MSSSPTYGTWLETVRVARGFTQARLSSETGLGQGVISKLESGSLPMDRARLAALADALEVPGSLLDGSVELPPHARVFHRKQASLPAKAANRLNADLALAHFRVARVLRDEEMPQSLHRPIEDALDTPEGRARELRMAWDIAPGPIPNMVALLESKGVPCLMWDVESAKVDAIASWPDDARPIVMLGSHAPGDRLRFTVAHELGHAVLHDLPAAEREKEADAFASEFLMPRRDIKDDLKDVSLPRLAELKRKWGTSIAALVRRARDIGAITDYAYRDFNIELSVSGYRKNEPISIAQEKPSLIAKAIAAREVAGETLDEIAEDAFVSVEELQSRYMEVK